MLLTRKLVQIILAEHRSEPTPTRRILQTWLPLAATWILMTGEGPLLAAFIARQVAPELNLAAWSVVFPIVLIISAPGITLLSASTSLVKDIDSYKQIRRYVLWLTGIMSGIHVLLAFTPFYDFLMQRVIGAPPELIEPARVGIQIMLPFSAALSYRRFANGILIRYGRANVITIGAVMRLTVSMATLTICMLIGGVSGVVGATVGITLSVITECIYATWKVGPVIDRNLRTAPKMEERVNLGSFLAFYIPLVLTTLIYILLQPMIASALSRMPLPIPSLAAWPVLYGIVMMIGSGAFAFIEVVVVMLDEPHARPGLVRVAAVMGSCMVVALLLFNMTGLATIWLRYVAALPPDLIPNVRSALWLAIPIPGLYAADSLFSGALMNGRRTRAVTEGALVSISVLGALLVGGVLWGGYPGLLVSTAAMVISGTARTIWLGKRAWPVLVGK